MRLGPAGSPGTAATKLAYPSRAHYKLPEACGESYRQARRQQPKRNKSWLRVCHCHAQLWQPLVCQALASNPNPPPVCRSRTVGHFELSALGPAGSSAARQCRGPRTSTLKTNCARLLRPGLCNTRKRPLRVSLILLEPDGEFPREGRKFSAIMAWHTRVPVQAESHFKLLLTAARLVGPAT